MKKLYYIFSVISLMFFSACENQDWSFPDYGKRQFTSLINIPLEQLCSAMMRHLTTRLIININV